MGGGGVNCDIYVHLTQERYLANVIFRSWISDTIRYTTTKFRFVLDCLHDSCFKYTFSPGDFVDVYQRRQESSTTEQQSEVEEQTEATVADQSLFSCPSEGCIKVYQRYSALEKHLFFGMYKLIPEQESLLDKEKRSYQSKLVEGTSAQATDEGDVTVQLQDWCINPTFKVESVRSLLFYIVQTIQN